MKDREQLSCWIHHSMAVTGGYLGVYALLCRSDFFGNALTSNLIYIVTGILGREPLDVLIRIGGVVLYVLGIASTVLLSKKYHRNLHPISLTINYIVVGILGFLPAEMNPVIGLYPIFFAMAFQWNSFPGAYGFAGSTIFLRTMPVKLQMRCRNTASRMKNISCNERHFSVVHWHVSILALHFLGSLTILLASAAYGYVLSRY